MASRRARPAPVQVAFDRIALLATVHATVASPSSKSGAYTGGRQSIPASGKECLTGCFTGSSFMSRMSSHESDLRYISMQADETISVPIAQLRADTEILDACVELQSKLRRLLKRTMYCELFPWCKGAPIHPAERMHLPILLPTVGNCYHGDYSTPAATYATEFEEAPYMWRCVPSRTTRMCRRCGQPAKIGLDNVWGYSIKVNPTGYSCRDATRTPRSAGWSHVSLSSTGYVPESLPTGFRLTREETFVTRRAMGDSFKNVAKGTIVLNKNGRQAPAARLEHLDKISMRTRTYLDETNELQHMPESVEKPAVKAKLWPRLAAAKIQRALRAHVGRTMLRSLKEEKWRRLRHWGTTTIQCAWAMHVGRAQLRRKHAMLVLRRWISQNPAVAIQRVVRGHHGRVAYRIENERCRQWRNIPKIQAAVRRTQQRALYTAWWVDKGNPLTWQIPDPTKMRLLEQPIASLHAACPHPALARHAAQKGHGSTCISGVASISGGYLLISALNSPVVGKVAFASPVRSYETDKSGALTAVGDAYLSFPGGASPLRKLRFFGDSGSVSPIKARNLFQAPSHDTLISSLKGAREKAPSTHELGPGNVSLEGRGGGGGGGGGNGAHVSLHATPRSLTPLSERSQGSSSAKSVTGSVGSVESLTSRRRRRSVRDVALSPLSARRSAERISSVTKCRNVSPQSLGVTFTEVSQSKTSPARAIDTALPGHTVRAVPSESNVDFSHTVGGVLQGGGLTGRMQHAQSLRQMFDKVRETTIFMGNK